MIAPGAEPERDATAVTAEAERAADLAVAETRGAERATARLRAILTAPEAVPCLALAVRVALDTTLPAGEALALLAAAVPQPARTGRAH
jgi:hypothetical protein